jgi:hypothetical protein
MHKVFDAQAKTGDVASGALVTKIGEQRRILLGLGLPHRADRLPSWRVIAMVNLSTAI